jgi:hypothetical protein
LAYQDADNVSISSLRVTSATITSSGANGLILSQDLDTSANSSRLFFASSSGNYSIVNSSGSLLFAAGGTPGSDTGTENIRITQSGNVGIGTSNPQHRLQVAGNIVRSAEYDANHLIGYTIPNIATVNTNVPRVILIARYGAVASVVNGVIYGNRSLASAATRTATYRVHVAVNSSGNVQHASLVTEGLTAGEIDRIVTCTYNGFNWIGIQVAGSSSSAYPTGYYFEGIANPITDMATIAETNVGSLTVFNNTASRVEFDNFGKFLIPEANVGIGIDPTVKLDVAQANAGGVAAARIINTATTSTVNSAELQLQASGDAGRYAYIRATLPSDQNNGNHLIFATNLSGGAPTEKMRIGNNGNVAINSTTTNYAKLIVNGAVVAGGVLQYTKAYTGLDTTGVVVGAVLGSSNGASCFLEVITFGGQNSGGYSRSVWNMRNAGGSWVYDKVVSEGGTNFTIDLAGTGPVTITFRSTSVSQGFTPTCVIRSSGSTLDPAYF